MPLFGISGSPAQEPGQGSADQRRSVVFRPAVSLVSFNIAGPADHSAGDADSLASRCFPQLLAMDVPE
jgi:hypothetical protein